MQVAVALQYLHEQHLIHRDVKPDNIFIDENENALLGDLGLISTHQLTRSLAGDLKYMAREVIRA
jgi:serine/threonine protein kinase